MNFKKFPKYLVMAVYLLRSLDIPQSIKLIQDVSYLWTEFYIKTEIKPVISLFKVRFVYKDKELVNFKLKDIKELGKIIEDLKKMRGERFR